MRVKHITLETLGTAATPADLNQVTKMMEGMGWDTNLPNEGKWARREDDDPELVREWETDLQKCLDRLPA